nr:SSB=28 kda single-stranded nucleic-acid-specific acidic protein {N-terminal} [Pisum sativum=peas, cv. Arkel, Peptide Chloroplast Partial, 17 aa] [Pisum sativum]
VAQGSVVAIDDEEKAVI